MLSLLHASNNNSTETLEKTRLSETIREPQNVDSVHSELGEDDQAKTILSSAPCCHYMYPGKMAGNITDEEAKAEL